MKKLSLLTLSTLVILCLLSSCGKFIEGDGPIVQESIAVSGNFTGVELAGGFQVIVTLGDVQSVVAEGQQNIIDRLIADVMPDGSLKLELEHGNYRHYDLTIYVTVPYADNFCVSGSGDMTVYQDPDGTLVLDKLDLRVSGSGNLKGVGDFVVTDDGKAKISGSGDINFVIDCNAMDAEITGSGNMYFGLMANEMDAEITGSGEINLDGNAPSQEIEITGSGDYKAYDFPCQTMTARITGSGDVECSVDTQLDATITGSGSVFYKNQPIVNVHITGSGSVKHVN